MITIDSMQESKVDDSLKVDVVDLFCGIGGLTFGLQSAGLNVAAGFDFDASCKFAYEANNKAVFHHKDISLVEPEEISKYFIDSDIKVLVGCAPCQPFSSYSFKHKAKPAEDKWRLLYQFARLIEKVEPDIVSMENVPQLVNFDKAPVLQDFINALIKMGYYVNYEIVSAPDYGVPQNRKRLILLASRLKEIKLIEPTHTRDSYRTVRDAIGHLSPLKHGESDSNDFAHKATLLSDLNLKRIQASKIGGSWKYDWTEDLKLACHKADSGKSYGSVYGRMKWDEPSPTMTTFCTGLGNGRFGHPEQDRPITLREAAILQSFPPSYVFAPNKDSFKVSVSARHVGNAVPPKLGEIIGKSIIEHLKDYKNGESKKQIQRRRIGANTRPDK